MPASKTVIRTRQRKPSAFDVAREAGVSQTTVSFVLNERSGQSIPEVTRNRVMDAVQKLGYRPNTLARSLAHGKTNTIGLVLPFLDSQFHQSIVVGLQRTLRLNNYQLLFSFSDPYSERDGKVVDFLLQHRVDALVFIGAGKNIAAIMEWMPTLKQQNIPAIVVDDSSFAGHIDCVVSDDRNGIDRAMQHLFDLGHRRIAYLSEVCDLENPPDKPFGYLAARRKLGLAYQEIIGAKSHVTAEEVRDQMETLLKSEQPPTAFVATNDFMFESFLMSSRRLEIPESLSLVGYGNQYLAKVFELDSVNQFPEEMGRAAGERLLDRLERPDLSIKTIVTPTSLVIRDSSAPARN